MLRSTVAMFVWPQNAIVMSSSLRMISSALRHARLPIAPSPYRNARPMYVPRAPSAHGLQHVLARADAAVQMHLDLRADGVDDRGERLDLDGAPSS